MATTGRREARRRTRRGAATSANVGRWSALALVAAAALYALVQVLGRARTTGGSSSAPPRPSRAAEPAQPTAPAPTAPAPATTAERTQLPKVSAPAQRALQEAGITHLEDLTDRAAGDLLALHGVGPKTVESLRAALAEHQLSLRDEQ